MVTGKPGKSSKSKKKKNKNKNVLTEVQNGNGRQADQVPEINGNIIQVHIQSDYKYRGVRII